VTYFTNDRCGSPDDKSGGWKAAEQVSGREGLLYIMITGQRGVFEARDGTVGFFAALRKT
jgi:hypothetical protein